VTLLEGISACSLEHDLNLDMPVYRVLTERLTHGLVAICNATYMTETQEWRRPKRTKRTQRRGRENEPHAGAKQSKEDKVLHLLSVATGSCFLSTRASWLGSSRTRRRDHATGAQKE